MISTPETFLLVCAVCLYMSILLTFMAWCVTCFFLGGATLNLRFARYRPCVRSVLIVSGFFEKIRISWVLPELFRILVTLVKSMPLSESSDSMSWTSISGITPRATTLVSRATCVCVCGGFIMNVEFCLIAKGVFWNLLSEGV